MLQGTIMKGYSGFYYVNVEGVEIECSLRGKYRQTKQSFLPGDIVNITMQPDGTGVIERVEPRKNQLIRPPIANVDQVIIVMALKEPEPQLGLLDRLLVLAESKGIYPVICFNKADIAQEELDVAYTYEKIGYKVIVTSTISATNISKLADVLRGKVSVFAGLSGVGKTSILNAISPDLALKTGAVSTKIKRGKHTTRHVELIALPSGGLVADTPGFSNLNIEDIPSNRLSLYFPEFSGEKIVCRFNPCLHHREPSCGVKAAVESGEIASSRYANYLILLDELVTAERRYR